MRRDSIGFFWQDLPPVKPPKVEKVKRTPPERTWESPDYLPGLEEALAFNIPQFTDEELLEACGHHELLVFDIECYENYWLIAFQSLQSGKVTYFELTEHHGFHLEKLQWIVSNFCLISFNGIGYDIPVLSLALAGRSNEVLKQATTRLIEWGERPSDVLKSHKVKSIKCDHVDLIEVAPLQGSLKAYGGRLHAPRMQDLPFHPSTILSDEQIAIVRWYCVNDLKTTGLLYHKLKGEVDLRVSLSNEYRVDLRSKSDAQIAESIISSEIRKIVAGRINKPVIEPGTVYYYRVPSFIQFYTPLMNWALNIIRNVKFTVSEFGNIGMPAELSELALTIAGGVYRMGIGGLHSSETCVSYHADEDTVLIDRDVTSYYPAIILNLGLFPHHLGQPFLHVYRQIVERRLAAKKAGNKVVADSLKITVNGSFGKLGSPYSVLYSPDLLIQVTITGQLALLMLIERLELSGIQVMSANTDGIMIRCPKAQLPLFEQIITTWEQQTGFQTEEARYRALYSRDVNNYIAVKEKGAPKTKGAYAPTGLSKNPTNQICVDSVIEFLTNGTAIEATIKACSDVTKFVTVRKVKGGAVKDGTYLGKTIRWYYAAGEEGEIVYADSGNKVPRSEGAKPLMDLPDQLPSDINYEWYVEESKRILVDVGYKEMP